MSLKTSCIANFPLLHPNPASKDLCLGNYIEHWFRISTRAFKSVPTLKIILKEKKVACFFFFFPLTHFVVAMLFGDAEILSDSNSLFLYLAFCLSPEL